MTSTSPAPFDREALLERSLGSGAIMEEVLVAFLAEARESLRALHSALTRGNLDLAREHAHTLRGAAANAGAAGLHAATTEFARVAARIAPGAGAVRATPPALAAALEPLDAELARFDAAVAAEFGANNGTQSP